MKPRLFIATSLALALPFVPLPAQWQSLSPPPVQARALMNRGSTWYASGFGGGIVRTTDRGTTWVPINTGLSVTDVPAIAHLESDLIAGTLGGGCFLSSDDGASWWPITHGLPKNPYDTNTFAIVQALAVSDGAIFAGTYYGVYRTTDRGLSWVGLNAGLTFLNVTALAVEGPLLFAGTNGGGLFRSTDGGASWARSDSATPGGSVHAVDLRGRQVFAVRSDVVRASGDSGNTWRTCDLGPWSGNRWSLAVSDTRIAVGSSGAIHVSADSGWTWHRYVEGLPTSISPVYALCVADSMLVAVLGSTAWARPLADPLTSVSSDGTLLGPTARASARCFPNPFNPRTTISYRLPARSQVRLAIFNLLGQEIALLQEGVAEPGEHRVEWTAHVPSGAYWYRLVVQTAGRTAEDPAVVGKMILAR